MKTRIPTRTLSSALTIASFALALALVPSGASADRGKDLFLAKKCNKCHTVESHGIELLKPKKKFSDLSKTGSKRDATWLTGWLRKEIATPKGDKEIKHKTKFKGSDEELAGVVKWLMTLK